MDKLKLFVSWSGNWSGEVAGILRSWLPDVLQFVEPWLSSADIEKGTRWSVEVARELESTSVGLICLTPDNLTSEWILFESGALSKSSQNTYVCTFLHGMKKTDLAPPLSQFQATEATKEDTLKLVQTINQAYEGGRLSPEQLTRVFDRWWPDLEERLRQIQLSAVPGGGQRPPRPEREILEEVLSICRAIDRGDRPIRAADSEAFAMYSHELRTPVNAIVGYSSLLLVHNQAAFSATDR